MELLPEQFWANNQVLVQGGQRAQATLARAGIPSLVLKGAAMIRRYYPDPSLRSMGDYDVLVPSSAGRAALELLQGQGWRDADGKSPDRVQGQHGRPLQHPDHPGWSLDLHWYALSECRWPGADDGFWQRSQEGLLDPADELIVLCCQACRLKARSAWMLDATYLLEHVPDWTVLREECRARHVEIPVAIALGFLRRELGLGVPELGLASSGWTDRLYFHSKQSGPAALLLVTDFLRTRRPLSSFLDYLVERWGLSSKRSLPRELARRMRR